jgi:multicomponent Na+:H+ antiporter subunit B
MRSVILRTAAPFLAGLMVLFSIYVLMRGHNEPGGGFIGGLIGAAALALICITNGPAALRKAMRLHPFVLAAGGLLMAALSALPSALFGEVVMTGLWWFPESFPDLKVLSTVVLFDIGVYFVVIGAVTGVVLALEEAP